MKNYNSKQSWDSIFLSATIFITGILIYIGLIKLAKSHRFKIAQKCPGVVFIMDSKTGEVYEYTSRGWLGNVRPYVQEDH